ncbi:hypothetical protein KCP69_19640 [Salmonella enterica subsp. enterica]|nr:hypothetical protein KCP69_19640 [Salmonella enterica subsp. enterica]
MLADGSRRWRQYAAQRCSSRCYLSSARWRLSRGACARYQRIPASRAGVIASALRIALNWQAKTGTTLFRRQELPRRKGVTLTHCRTFRFDAPDQPINALNALSFTGVSWRVSLFCRAYRLENQRCYLLTRAGRNKAKFCSTIFRYITR